MRTQAEYIRQWEAIEHAGEHKALALDIVKRGAKAAFPDIADERELTIAAETYLDNLIDGYDEPEELDALIDSEDRYELEGWEAEADYRFEQGRAA